MKYDATEMTAATNQDCIGWYLNITFWWRVNETFDNQRFKSIKGDILDGENEQIFCCWVGLFPILRVFHKGSWEGGAVYTWWVQQFCGFLVKREGDNPAGHGFNWAFLNKS